MFNKLLVYALSWSIAFGPVAAHAEGDASRGSDLVEAANALLDRAAFPKIPRLGVSGAPSSGELDAQQSQLRALRASVQAKLLENIRQTKDTGGGNDAASELLVQQALDALNSPIENYFEAAGKIESLKIMLGVPANEKAWDQTYTLRAPLGALGQIRFLEAIGLHSPYAVYLPVAGYDKEKVSAQLKENYHYRSTIELNAKNEWELVLRLNPEFASRMERFKFLTRPELKSAFQVAMHFSAESLYTSLGVTRTLLGQEPETMPEVPAGASRYLSLRLARQARIDEFKREMYNSQKPEIFKAVVDTLENMNRGGNTSLFAREDFWKEFARLAGRDLRSSTPEQYASLATAEFEEFTRAEAALLNLVDLKQTYRTQEFYLERAKILSLRSLLITASKEPLTVTPELENFITAHARRWADEIANSSTIVTQIEQIKRKTARDLLRTKRVEFQKKVEAAAASLRDFENQEINVAYLYGSKKWQIERLQPSPFVAKVLQEIERKISYEAAYLAWREKMYTYLAAFTFKGQTAQPAPLAILNKIVPKMTFNPAALKVPAKYAEALNAPGVKGWIESLVDYLPGPLYRNAKRWTPEAPDARKKDLLDLLEVAHLLKFDRYEKLNGQRATPDTLKLDGRGLNKVLRTERRAYLNEMERDVLFNSPILGGQKWSSTPTNENGDVETTALWQLLAEPGRSAADKYELVEAQLRTVERQIYSNQRELDGQIGLVDALPERASLADIEKLSSDVQLIVTHASQIRLGLQSFSSFAVFYEDMQREIELGHVPHFVSRTWVQLTSFANSVVMVGLLQIFLPKAMFGVRALQGMSAGLQSMIAAVFGPGFSRVMPLALAAFGLEVGEAAYRGYVSEAQRLESLRKYFECGSSSEARCIAVYSDVANQTDVMEISRHEFLGKLAILVAIPLGLRAKRAFDAYRQLPTTMTLRLVRQDAATLGLSDTSSLSEPALEQAMRNSVTKAQAVNDLTAQLMTETYARQAYYRLQNRLQAEALRWQQTFAQYRPELHRFGFADRNWTTDASFDEALTQVETWYREGRLLSTDYNSIRGTLLQMYQTMKPAFKLMERDPLMQNFFARVWSQANSSSRVGLAVDYHFTAQQFETKMMARMDAYYGRGLRSIDFDGRGRPYVIRQDLYPASSRFDQMIDKVAREILETPQLTEKRMNEMLRSFGGRP